VIRATNTYQTAVVSNRDNIGIEFSCDTTLNVPLVTVTLLA